MAVAGSCFVLEPATFLLILVLTLLKTATFIQTKMPLQEFDICHTHYVIPGRNRKEKKNQNPQQNCCRKHFLFLALLFYRLYFIVAVELKANEKNRPIPDTNFVGFYLGIESSAWIFSRQFASQIIWKIQTVGIFFPRQRDISVLSHLYFLQVGDKRPLALGLFVQMWHYRFLSSPCCCLSRCWQSALEVQGCLLCSFDIMGFLLFSFSALAESAIQIY